MTLSTEKIEPIGYVVHLRTPGNNGGETRSYQVAQALAALDVPVSLYGKVDHQYKWDSQITAENLITPWPLGVFQILIDLWKRNIHVLIERYQFPLFNVGVWAQLVRKKPIILEVHGFPIDEYLILSGNQEAGQMVKLLSKIPVGIWEKVQQYIFHHTQHFIVTSSGTKKILVEKGITEEKISVVYNSVNPDVFRKTEDQESCRRRVNLPANVPLILYAGSSFHEELITTINAIPDVLSHFPSAKFVYFCDEARQEHLQAAADRLGLPPDSFEVRPLVPHHLMPALLTAVDVVLAPYSLESKRFKTHFHYSPLKVMEALALEKPVVTVNAQELKDIFGGVDNVLFAESGDSRTWSAAICRGVEAEPEALSAGREFVLDGYRWEDIAITYLELIKAAK